MNIAHCRSCGRNIIWTESPTGAKLPLDPRPVTTYAIRERPDTAVPLAVVDAADDPAAKQYVSHFLTCPTVDQHT